MPEDAPAGAEHQRPVPADQGGERRLVAVQEPAQQGGVGQGVEPLPLDEVVDVPGDEAGRAFGHRKNSRGFSTPREAPKRGTGTKNGRRYGRVTNGPGSLPEHADPEAEHLLSGRPSPLRIGNPKSMASGHRAEELGHRDPQADARRHPVVGQD